MKINLNGMLFKDKQIQISEQNQVTILGEGKKEEDALLKDGVEEEEEIDLQIKKEIIKIDLMKIEMKEMAGLLLLVKSLTERKKVLKKGFLIKRKDFLEKEKILKTNLS